MKKLFTLLALVGLSVGLAGCGDTKPDPAKPATTPAPATK